MPSSTLSIQLNSCIQLHFRVCRVQEVPKARQVQQEHRWGNLTPKFNTCAHVLDSLMLRDGKCGFIWSRSVNTLPRASQVASSHISNCCSSDPSRSFFFSCVISLEARSTRWSHDSPLRAWKNSTDIFPALERRTEPIWMVYRTYCFLLCWTLQQKPGTRSQRCRAGCELTHTWVK